MAIKIKISQQDDLKIIKSRQFAPLGQTHKNKKAYSRQSKYKKLDN